jgi:thiamine biosynthesis protein ThiS
MKAHDSKVRARIVANGRLWDLELPCTVAGFLAERGLKPTQVVVELNGQTLGRWEFGRVQLKEGDRLEVVLPVAGG